MFATTVSKRWPVSESTGTLQVRQLLPGTLKACPYNYRRPRNIETFRAACTAAEGEPVREYDAGDVRCGMAVWLGDVFWPVDEPDPLGDGRVQLAFSLSGGAVIWKLRPDVPVYVLMDAAPLVMH